jgi:hypothetical protein
MKAVEVGLLLGIGSVGVVAMIVSGVMSPLVAVVVLLLWLVAVAIGVRSVLVEEEPAPIEGLSQLFADFLYEKQGKYTTMLLLGETRTRQRITATLKTLSWPENVFPVYVDLRTFTAENREVFWQELATVIHREALQGLGIEQVPPYHPPSMITDWWLQEVDRLHNEGKTLLIIFDGADWFGEKIAAGGMKENLLMGKLRHITQFHPAVRMVFVASEPEAIAKEWHSYFIASRLERL